MTAVVINELFRAYAHIANVDSEPRLDLTDVLTARTVHSVNIAALLSAACSAHIHTWPPGARSAHLVLIEPSAPSTRSTELEEHSSNLSKQNLRIYMPLQNACRTQWLRDAVNDCTNMLTEKELQCVAACVI